MTLKNEEALLQDEKASWKRKKDEIVEMEKKVDGKFHEHEKQRDALKVEKERLLKEKERNASIEKDLFEARKKVDEDRELNEKTRLDNEKRSMELRSMELKAQNHNLEKEKFAAYKKMQLENFEAKANFLKEKELDIEKLRLHEKEIEVKRDNFDEYKKSVA